MRKTTPALALLASIAAFQAPALAQADAPQDALKNTTAYKLVADLTSQVGQRLAGTPREAYARQWAVKRLAALGFAHPHIEPYTMPGWVRGEEKAMLLGAAEQKLAITALGDSGATPAGGITAPMVYFASFNALKVAPDSAVKGRIVFIDNAMQPLQDGGGYGPYGDARRAGPAVAASKGAVAVLIRSIGTDHNRDPHTGVTGWPKGVTPIPAAAVSVPDAELIALRAAHGVSEQVALTLTPRFTGPSPSGNVVADIPGRDPKLPPILVGCHLDSWDLATGAIDDGAGCAIVTAAALQATHGAPVLRTIRVLWAGGEERGGFGGEAYAKAHAGEPHALAMESDTGAGRVWQAVISLGAADKALGDAIAARLSDMGVIRGHGEAEGGEDVGYIAHEQKAAVIDMRQDMTHYFDLHHTPDDTLDKINPADLQQNVDTWAEVLKIVGNAPVIARQS
ncbi:MAG: M28 family peptidase [Sphingomonadales bacterium]|nr:M28 family peptidase [Sphingomonadales bacterium]MDE2168554.1 M28 family peptidase [Sphingomonadales bacterium]